MRAYSCFWNHALIVASNARKSGFFLAISEDSFQSAFKSQPFNDDPTRMKIGN